MKTRKKYFGILSILGIILFALEIISCKSGNNKLKSPERETIAKVVNTAPAGQLENTTNQITKIDLTGHIGTTKEWNSGWLNLDRPFDFKTGDTLTIEVGGTARKVIIRLLSINDDPNSPVGIVGREHTVDNNGLVIMNLIRDYPGIKQISAHGGENPWGVYSLGANNGAATVLHVTVIRR